MPIAGKKKKEKKTPKAILALPGTNARRRDWPAGNGSLSASSELVEETHEVKSLPNQKYEITWESKAWCICVSLQYCFRVSIPQISRGVLLRLLWMTRVWSTLLYTAEEKSETGAVQLLFSGSNKKADSGERKIKGRSQMSTLPSLARSPFALLGMPGVPVAGVPCPPSHLNTTNTRVSVQKFCDTTLRRLSASPFKRGRRNKTRKVGRYWQDRALAGATSTHCCNATVPTKR